MQLGTPLPSFQLIDQEGVLFNSKSLLGQPSVLFFYPKISLLFALKEIVDLETLIIYSKTLMPL